MICKTCSIHYCLPLHPNFANFQIPQFSLPHILKFSHPHINKLPHFHITALAQSVSQVAKELLNAFNPDVLEDIEQQVSQRMLGESPDAIQSEIQHQHSEIIEKAGARAIIVIFKSPSFELMLAEKTEISVTGHLVDEGM